MSSTLAAPAPVRKAHKVRKADVGKAAEVVRSGHVFVSRKGKRAEPGKGKRLEGVWLNELHSLLVKKYGWALNKARAVVAKLFRRRNPLVRFASNGRVVAIAAPSQKARGEAIRSGRPMPVIVAAVIAVPAVPEYEDRWARLADVPKGWEDFAGVDDPNDPRLLKMCLPNRAVPRVGVNEMRVLEPLGAPVRSGDDLMLRCGTYGLRPEASAYLVTA